MLLPLLLMAAAQAEPDPAPADATPAPPAAPLSADEAREINEDSARDLRESRFYNKPGATRAQYDADWQECRLIARGSQTMGGQTVVVPYNPGIISPVAAAGGGMLGALIGSAIVEGDLRRANRRTCLLVKGWNLVEVEDSEMRARAAAMTDAERDAHFNRLVGAHELPSGVNVIRWRNRLAEPAIITPLAPRKPPKPGAQPDPKVVKLVEIAPDQGGVVLAFRRPDALSQDRSAAVLLSRYDPETAAVVFPEKRQKGDRTTYSVLLKSRDKTLEVEHVVAALTPGTYVISGATPAAQGLVNVNFCLGSAMFTVEPGKITYIGDFIPHPGVPVEGGLNVDAMTWQNHPDAARAGAPRLLKAGLPVVDAGFTNGASWGCAATNMAAYAIPGAPALEGPRRAGPARGPAPAPTTIIAVPSGR